MDSVEYQMKLCLRHCYEVNFSVLMRPGKTLAVLLIDRSVGMSQSLSSSFSMMLLLLLLKRRGSTGAVKSSGPLQLLEGEYRSDEASVLSASLAPLLVVEPAAEVDVVVVAAAAAAAAI